MTPVSYLFRGRKRDGERGVGATVFFPHPIQEWQEIAGVDGDDSAAVPKRMERGERSKMR